MLLWPWVHGWTHCRDITESTNRDRYYRHHWFSNPINRTVEIDLYFDWSAIASQFRIFGVDIGIYPKLEIGCS